MAAGEPLLSASVDSSVVVVADEGRKRTTTYRPVRRRSEDCLPEEESSSSEMSVESRSPPSSGTEKDRREGTDEKPVRERPAERCLDELPRYLAERRWDEAAEAMAIAFVSTGPQVGAPPSDGETTEEEKERRQRQWQRRRLEELLRDADSRGVPVGVLLDVARASLSRGRRDAERGMCPRQEAKAPPTPTATTTRPAVLSFAVPWPNNMPVIRTAVAPEPASFSGSTTSTAVSSRRSGDAGQEAKSGNRRRGDAVASSGMAASALRSVGAYLSPSSSSAVPDEAKRAVVRLILFLCDGESESATTESVDSAARRGKEEDVLIFLSGGRGALPPSVERHPILRKLRKEVRRSSTGAAVEESSVRRSGRNGSRKRTRPVTPVSSEAPEADGDEDAAGGEELGALLPRDSEKREEADEEDEGERPSTTIRTGEYVASKIASGAQWFEKSLLSSSSAAVRGIDSAGLYVRDRVAPREGGPALSDRDRIVVRTYTDAARRATGGARVTARTAAAAVRGTSARGAAAAAERFRAGGWGEKIIPDRESRDALAAAGTVGIAALGAAAVVAEAAYDASAAVVGRTAEVAADIVRKRHGEDAGRITRDACESVGNVFGTARDVRGLRTTVAVSKGVLKQEGKARIRGEAPQQKVVGSKMTAEYVSELRQHILPMQSMESYAE